VVQPFILGCDTKNPKVVQLSLGAIQRLISHQLLNEVSYCSGSGTLICRLFADILSCSTAFLPIVPWA
jgi:Dimerisation and cyclophilin-binding domain of Mon2